MKFSLLPLLLVSAAADRVLLEKIVTVHYGHNEHAVDYEDVYSDRRELQTDKRDLQITLADPNGEPACWDDTDSCAADLRNCACPTDTTADPVDTFLNYECIDNNGLSYPNPISNAPYGSAEKVINLNLANILIGFGYRATSISTTYHGSCSGMLNAQVKINDIDVGDNNRDNSEGPFNTCDSSSDTYTDRCGDCATFTEVSTDAALIQSLYDSPESTVNVYSGSDTDRVCTDRVILEFSFGSILTPPAPPPQTPEPSPAPSKAPSGGQGDPHFMSWMGEHFEYHGQCDMVLAKDEGFANGLGLFVHIRTKIVRNWSYIKNVAIRIGDDTIEIEGHGVNSINHHWINSEYLSEQATIGGFPLITHLHEKGTKRTYEIDLSSKYPNQKIEVSTWKEFVKVDFKNGNKGSYGNVVGLLGSYKTGQTLARDGMTNLDDFSALGSEWQVLPSEPMLFREVEEPQFPKKCVEPEDPQGERRRRLDEMTVAEEAAEAACAHLKTEWDRKDCVYDIVATQDLGMVGAY